jgi:hypothetical protein
MNKYLFLCMNLIPEINIIKVHFHIFKEQLISGYKELYQSILLQKTNKKSIVYVYHYFFKQIEKLKH